MRSYTIMVSNLSSKPSTGNTSIPMSKAVVPAAAATASFLLIILLYKVIRDDDKSFDSNIKLHRRLGYNISPPHFDPLVEKIERLNKNQETTKNTNSLQENLRYLDDVGRLNITLRLMVLFPVLDWAPKDGLIDYKEMEYWILKQTLERLNFRTKKVLESNDTNGDGFISFSEYLPQFSNEDVIGDGEAGRWYEQFRNADVDDNGLLNFDELKDFLHPEDSTNLQIQEWLLKDNIRQMDYDGDQKLDLMEFQNGAYDSYKHYFEYQTDGDEIVPPVDDVFAKLDLNEDKLLDAQELKPIFQYLSPGELQQAKHYTRFLIREADENGDGALTIHEMINNEYIFYNTVYDTKVSAHEDLHREL